MFFDCGDADFELEAFVGLALLEFGEFGVETVDVVFGRHLAFDIGDVVGDRGEAALDGREDAVERRLGLLDGFFFACICGSIAYRLAGALEAISRSMKIGKERANFGSGEGFRDHADWMRGASRISTGEAGRARG